MTPANKRHHFKQLLTAKLPCFLVVFALIGQLLLILQKANLPALGSFVLTCLAFNFWGESLRAARRKAEASEGRYQATEVQLRFQLTASRIMAESLDYQRTLE